MHYTILSLLNIHKHAKKSNEPIWWSQPPCGIVNKLINPLSVVIGLLVDQIGCKLQLDSSISENSTHIGS